MADRTFEEIEETIHAIPPDYYRILDLAREATTNEIKKAFKACSRVTHPDKNPDKIQRAENVFKTIHQAYKALIDPLVRSSYDKTGVVINDTAFYKYQHLYGAAIPVMPIVRAEHITINRGYDLWLEVAQHKAEYARRVPCQRCKGVGRIWATCSSCYSFGCTKCTYKGITIEGCDKCEGSGYALHMETITLDRSAKNGHWLRFEGKGDCMVVKHGVQVAGDLYVRLGACNEGTQKQVGMERSGGVVD